MSARDGLRRVAAFAIAAAVLVQLAPYGRNHIAPPAGTPTAWDTDRTEQLARRACFDCHSNETRWPWYAAVAPASWRVQHDVDEGRVRLNFSALNTRSEEGLDALREAGKVVTEGEMPPLDYRLLHPEARLTPEEKRTLALGLERSLARLAALDGGREALDLRQEALDDEDLGGIRERR
jgi:mono/diheme cytochrome c family protein